MNYQKHYKLLIEKAKQRTTELYTEQHHIIPRCLGGADEKDNLVALTPEEHYVAHQLLVKMHPDNRSLIYAAIMMIPKSANNKQRSNKMYGWLRRKYQSVCKQRVGNKNDSYGRRWYHDPNTHQNGKFREDEVPQGWVLGRVPRMRDRYCKKCEKKVDTVLVKLKLANKIYCEDCRKEKQEKQEKNNKEIAYYWYNKLLESNTRSIREFVKISDYDKSHGAFTSMLKKYVEEFTPQRGMPFSG